MKRYPKLLEVVAMLLMALVLTNGCITRGVWTERVYHPHADPRLNLLASPERPSVLVGYREQLEQTRRIRWRAFWIDLNTPYDEFQIPTFVEPANYPGLIPIPLLAARHGTNEIPKIGYAAMPTLDKPGFDLWHDGQPLGRFHLPAYEGDAPITAETVAKTPITLIVDGAIVILVAVAVAAVVYASLQSQD